MTSSTTGEFRETLARLPEEVRRAAKKNYALWLVEPRHPSLHFKRVNDVPSFYSIRIGIGWRALALVENDHATWFWIGSHADYDRFLPTL